MKPTLKRIVGVGLILTAVTGVLLSILGIFSIWRVRTIVLLKFYETTEIIHTGLGATSEGLAILENTLDTVSDTIASTERVTLSISQTMGDFNTMTSLLMGLTNLIPGSQGSGINPSETSANLTQAETELSQMASQINLVGGSLTEAQIAVNRYQLLIQDTETQVMEAQLNAPKWITMITWVLTLGFVWLFLTQVGLFVQGIDYLTNHHPARGYEGA